MELLRNIWNEEDGQGMAEYALILALIAVVVIVTLSVLGGKIRDLFTKVSGSL